MRIDANHRLSDVNWQASTHWDERPVWAQLELIVVHCISLPEGQFGTGYPRELFIGQLDPTAHSSFADLEGVEVAPHVLIDREGHVTQFVSFDKRAWHAGASSWGGRPRCNDFSIGIELEGSISTPYELVQYDALNQVVVALLEQYPTLGLHSLAGHHQIAPGRKQDPGAYFDWSGLHASLTDRVHLAGL